MGIEKNVGLLTVLILIAISFGAMVQITPLMFQQQTMEPVTGLRPYTALELEGRDIYIREGCVGCHSQMIRPFRAETERYGHYSVAGESVWEHPFIWGSVYRRRYRGCESGSTGQNGNAGPYCLSTISWQGLHQRGIRDLALGEEVYLEELPRVPSLFSLGAW